MVLLMVVENRGREESVYGEDGGRKGRKGKSLFLHLKGMGPTVPKTFRGPMRYSLGSTRAHPPYSRSSPGQPHSFDVMNDMYVMFSNTSQLRWFGFMIVSDQDGRDLVGGYYGGNLVVN